MRKRKGAALPTAIIMCVFLLIISFSVSAFVVQAVSLNNVYRIKSNRNLIYLKSNQEFISGNPVSDTTLKWEIYDGENNIKALAAYGRATDQMVFYSIYDFDNNEQLAYQTSNFYITTVGDVNYLGGIVPIVRV